MRASIVTFAMVIVVITTPPGQSTESDEEAAFDDGLDRQTRLTKIANSENKGERASFDDGLEWQIRAATHEWQRLVSRRSAKAMARRYAEKCVYMKQGEFTAYKSQRVEALYDKWFRSGIVRCDVDERGFRELSGKHAYVWGTYTSYAKGHKGQGDMEAESGTFVQLYERFKGGFKIIVEGRTVFDIRSGGKNNTSTC